MIPVWLFLVVVLLLISAVGVLALQRDRARFEAGDLRAELAGMSTSRGAS